MIHSVAVLGGLATERARIAAAVGLREGEGSPTVAVDHSREVLRALVFGPVPSDHDAGDLVGVEDSREAHPAPAEFFYQAGVGFGAEPETSVFGGDGRSEEAELAHLVEHLLGELICVFEFARAGDHFAIDPGGDHRDELVGDLLIGPVLIGPVWEAHTGRLLP